MPKIQFKRGLKTNLPVLNEGEPGFTTDTEEFFIGSKDGNIEFAKQSDLNATNTQVASNTNALTNLVNTNTNAEVINARGSFSILGDRLSNIDTQLGAETLTTTAQDVKGAINEVDAQLAEIPSNPNTVPTQWDVFVIYGQSNAFGFASNTPGRGTIPNYTYYWKPSVSDIVPAVYEFENTNPGTPTSDGNAWIEFAREYRDKTGRGVIFIHAPMGGKSIAQLSRGGDPDHYFDNMINACTAMAAKASGRYTIRSWSMLFVQGEQDQQIATTRDTYVSQFNAFWTDVKASTPITKCYISKTGCPNYVNENNWYDVHIAQDYICQTNSDVIMAFDKAGAFTTTNGLLRDGVHYTQKGYNIMGLEMAKSVVVCENNNTIISPRELEQYGKIQAPPDQIYRMVSATIGFDGTNFVLQTLTGSARRSAFVTGISVSSSGIALNLSGRIDDVLFVGAKLNSYGIQKGLKVDAVDYSASNSKSIILNFRQDATFIVDTANAALSYPPNGSGANTGLLADVVAVNTGGHTKITHLGSDSIPSAVGYGYGVSDIDNFTPVGIVVPASNEFWVKYAASPAPTTTKVICAIPSMKLNPVNMKVPSLEIQVFAVVAERSR